ncbi:hypothetical protein [Pelagicoccus sp. SDUM812002]|uniref:hypothetical protein n=1 Tax=Pelagicoccus sp. SDUM812002 TaxID=3041266 RepID=UPI00280DB29D|nr:hypothetical protein [Pelagicoccus sp. SDUM812002]MDQ8185384.1 hypothetical protein [Pelagicoccus sp. SDUM812002]
MPRKPYDWQLPPEIESRLSEDSYGPQRAISEAEHLLLVLHRPPNEDDLRREHILFLLTPDEKLLCNGSPDGIPKLDQLISDYRTRWEELENRYKLDSGASELFDLIEAVTPLKRSSANMANAIQKARELSKDYRYFIGVRDAAMDVSRAFEILLADLRAALDFRIAQKAEQQYVRSEEIAAAQHKLNVLAAFTFPVMAFATLLGMNLQHGFEKQSPFIFWGVLTGGVLIGVFVRSWILRKPRS